MPFWKGKKNSAKRQMGTASLNHPGASQQRDEVDSLLSSAQNLMLTNGPVEALYSLRNCPFISDERVRRWAHAVVWNHQTRLPKELLDESFLDSVWCQCKACEYTWLISPLLKVHSEGVSTSQIENVGLQCLQCDRVLCPQCERAAKPNCPCGGAFTNVRQPTGRKRRRESEPSDEAERLWFSELGDLPEPPPNVEHYFGFTGPVPIGIDPAFPLRQVLDTETHLTWAESLLHEGLFYQAQQQLDLLAKEGGALPKAKYLRARLRLTQLRNAKERYRRRDFSLGVPRWTGWPAEIKTLLQEAVTEAPELGAAWLSLAEVNLDESFGVDYRRAAECGRRAEDILGRTPAVLLVLGRALRGIDEFAEAVTNLRAIPADSIESIAGQQELKLAELEALCQADPDAVEAHLELGRWYLRKDSKSQAAKIFEGILSRHPERAEGHFGMGRLAFQNVQSGPERFENAYRFCQAALSRNAGFGLGWELLGLVFDTAKYQSNPKPTFEIGSALECYQHAIRYDPTCDFALRAVAENELKDGRLEPALQALEQAAQLDTNDAQVYYLLAAIYHGLRDFLKADVAYRKAKELWPEVELDATFKNRILKLCRYEY
jgi:tetratricopeptide (TPR) repeat protein